MNELNQGSTTVPSASQPSTKTSQAVETNKTKKPKFKTIATAYLN